VRSAAVTEAEVSGRPPIIGAFKSVAATLQDLALYEERRESQSLLLESKKKMA